MGEDANLKPGPGGASGAGGGWAGEGSKSRAGRPGEDCEARPQREPGGALWIHRDSGAGGSAVTRTAASGPVVPYSFRESSNVWRTAAGIDSDSEERCTFPVTIAWLQPCPDRCNATPRILKFSTLVFKL